VPEERRKLEDALADVHDVDPGPGIHETRARRGPGAETDDEQSLGAGAEHHRDVSHHPLYEA
jgi:hypothetical protein